MLGSWDMPKDTNNAAYTGQLLYVSSCRMFPNRTFPWHMFHELIQQKIKNCNVWWWVVILVRDVKTVYFSKPVTGLPKPVFYRLPKGLLWADNCHRSLCACYCYQSITCCFTAAVAHIPDARTPTPRNKGQWHIKAVGAEGTDVYAAMSW